MRGQDTKADTTSPWAGCEGLEEKMTQAWGSKKREVLTESAAKTTHGSRHSDQIKTLSHLTDWRQLPQRKITHVLRPEPWSAALAERKRIFPDNGAAVLKQQPRQVKSKGDDEILN
ncbi:MAG: hypothetical protein SGPRY_010134 [Prymnesium sp.]